MAQTRKPKVLIVDDEPDVVLFLKALLEDNGYEVASAATGLEAIACVKSERPDLITLDITMPEQSGVKTYRELKADPDLRAIPVVMVTGVADDFEHFISGRKHVPPPEGYISKPIAEATLLSVVGRLTAQRAP
jgi:CheY-like chemotaxis protein